jgi:hypothetical protein
MVYCVVMRHPFKTTPQKVFMILLARDPFLAVALHNRQLSAATDMRDVAPYCYTERVAGPFYTEETAKKFAQDLVDGTRGLPSLCRRILVLAHKYQVPCYGPEVPLPTPTVSAYLRDAGMPADYVTAAMRLEAAAEVLWEGAEGEGDGEEEEGGGEDQGGEM